MIGWNLILEYLIGNKIEIFSLNISDLLRFFFLGSATVTKALFLYIDQLSENVISNFFVQNMPMTGRGLGQYADIFSLGLAVVFSGKHLVLHKKTISNLRNNSRHSIRSQRIISSQQRLYPNQLKRCRNSHNFRSVESSSFLLVNSRERCRCRTRNWWFCTLRY